MEICGPADTEGVYTRCRWYGKNTSGHLRANILIINSPTFKEEDRKWNTTGAESHSENGQLLVILKNKFESNLKKQ